MSSSAWIDETCHSYISKKVFNGLQILFHFFYILGRIALPFAWNSWQQQSRGLESLRVETLGAVTGHHMTLWDILAITPNYQLPVLYLSSSSEWWWLPLLLELLWIQCFFWYWKKPKPNPSKKTLTDMPAQRSAYTREQPMYGYTHDLEEDI